MTRDSKQKTRRGMQIRAGRLVRRLVLASATVLAPLAGGAETLTDTLIAAYRNSNLLEQNRALVRASDEDVAQAVAALRPVFSLLSTTTTAARRDWDSTLALTMELLLFDAGGSRLAVEAAQESVLAARAGLVGEEQAVLLDAVTAYMDFRRDVQARQVAQNNVDVIEQELQASRDRFEVGEITRTDVSQAEARLAEARSNLAFETGNVEISRAFYKLAVGQFPGTLAAPPPEPALPGTLEQAVGIAREKAPAIRQAQHNVRVAELNVRRAKTATQPSLRLRADAGYSAQEDLRGNNDDYSARLTLSVPLYQGGALSALFRQSVAQTQQARSNLLQTALTVDDQVSRAWAALQVARASIVARQQQVEAQRLAFEGVQEEALLGARTTLDVLDAQQELLNAQLVLLEAERTEYVAVYSLLATMGLMTADHLGLNVPKYDPSIYYREVETAPTVSPFSARLDRVLKSQGRD
jgi:outer membrane protein